jgi:predicted DNA-binding transcriptional regulator AlpA
MKPYSAQIDRKTFAYEPARVDTAGIAAMLGCTRGHVTDRLTKRPDFPKPFINISQKMRYWRLSDVQAFITRKR